MTRQLIDPVTYNDVDYALAGFSGERFPEPQFFGIEPEGTATNCYRGYVINLHIRDDVLLLTDMILGVWMGELPHFFSKNHETLQHGQRKFNLDYQSSFTGGMIVGNDVVMPNYPLGRAVPESFETILEFIFTDGKLQTVHDHSATVRQLRIDVKEQLHHDLRDLLIQPPPPPKQPRTNTPTLLQRIQKNPAENDKTATPRRLDDLIQASKNRQSTPSKKSSDHRVTWVDDHWDVSYLTFITEISKRVKDIWKCDYQPLS